MYEIKTKDASEDFSSNKEIIDFSNHSTSWLKYYGNSNTLVIGKMKDEIRVIAIEKFVGLKPKIFVLSRQ